MYEVTVDDQVHPAVDALPAAALAPFAEVRLVLEMTPWNGAPINEDYPDAPVRVLICGPQHQGMITCLVVDDLRRVDILKLFWLN